MSIGQLIDTAMTEAQKEADKYTFPVFISDEKSKPVLVASSVIISLNNKHYLVTASHVLLEILPTGSPFIIGSQGQYFTIEGEFIYSEHDKNDHFDIAYIELSKEFMEVNKLPSLSQGQLITESYIRPPHIAFIHGYPNSINKQGKALRNTSSFKVRGYAYGGVIKKDFGNWEKFNKLESVHTCMTYGKTSNNQTPKFPQGISGGGLWIIKNSFKPTPIFLESIFIEYYKNDAVTFSTKISKIVSFIAHTKQNA